MFLYFLVFSYCKKIYPKLNISNIVEANEKVLFKNWCKVGSSECDTEKKVVPYRCLGRKDFHFFSFLCFFLLRNPSNVMFMVENVT